MSRIEGDVTNILTLDTLQFELKQSSLSGQVYPSASGPNGFDFVWALNFEFKRMMYRDQPWAPRLYYDELRLPIRSVRELANSVWEWDEAFDEETGEPNGCMYVCEHDCIYVATLKFGSRHENRFDVEWAGECGAHWIDHHRDDVPFSFAGSVELDTVTVQGSVTDSESILRTRLAEFLDPDDFSLLPLEPTGEETIFARFAPRPM